MALSAGQIKTAAQNAGFSGGNLTIAVAVALAESGGNPGATNHNTNGSTDFGLWQINSVHKDILASGSWSDPNSNAKMAMAVFRGSGWGAWSTYKSGAYLKFIGTAQSATGEAVPADAGGSTGESNPVAGAISGFTSSLTTFIQFFTDPKMWLRVGIFIAGGALAIIGLIVVIKDTSAGKAIVSAGKKAAGDAAMAALL